MKDKLPELVAFLRETDLTEVFWQLKSGSLNVKRTPIPAAPPAAAPSGVAASGSSETPQALQPSVIRSTMVGTFYRSDSKKDRPPLVIEGTVVNAGQPVACVEAMKILKDVLSPQSCRIVKVLVDNGHAVEYGQPLFEVAPLDEVSHV